MIQPVQQRLAAFAVAQPDGCAVRECAVVCGQELILQPHGLSQLGLPQIGVERLAHRIIVRQQGTVWGIDLQALDLRRQIK